MRIPLPFALLIATAFVCSVYTAPAHAQRVFVSATGSDGNPIRLIMSQLPTRPRRDFGQW
jgi:hypothetical protein